MKEVEVNIILIGTDKPTILFDDTNKLFSSKRPQVGHTINSIVRGLFMHIVSFNESFELNDMVYDNVNNEVFKVTNDIKRFKLQGKCDCEIVNGYPDRYGKVIASNDPLVNGERTEYGFAKHSLSIVPESFVEYYIESYNNGLKIEKVLVRYIEKMDMEIYYKYPYGDIAKEIGTGVYVPQLESGQIKILGSASIYKMFSTTPPKTKTVTQDELEEILLAYYGHMVDGLYTKELRDKTKEWVSKKF